MKKTNILLTSAGRRAYLVKWFKEALGDNGLVYAANSSVISTALAAADGYLLTPLIYDADYITCLLEFCSNNEITAIIPLFDIDLPILSNNKHLFEEIGVTVIVSQSNVIDICNDKFNTYKYLKEHNFNYIETYTSLSATVEAIDLGIIHYPLVIKPRWGMGSISVYTANDIDELTVLFNKAKQDIFNTYLKYESDSDIDNCVLIQQFIDGQEYGMDIINNLHGDFQTCIIREKLSMRSGETDCAKIIDNHDIYQIGKKLSLDLHHISNMDVDIIYSNGKYYVLELNARFGGGYPFSHMAGANLPKAIINWLNGRSASTLTCTSTNRIIQKDISLVYIDIAN